MSGYEEFASQGSLTLNIDVLVSRSDALLTRQKYLRSRLLTAHYTTCSVEFSIW